MLALAAVVALVAVSALLALVAVVAVPALAAEAAVWADGTVASVDSSMTPPVSPSALTWALVSVPFFSLPAPTVCFLMLLPLIVAAA